MTKYPDIAYAHGLRLPEQPLNSPSAACGSPLTNSSQPNTLPQVGDGLHSPFYTASSSGGRRGLHPGFDEKHLTSSNEGVGGVLGRDRTASGQLAGGIGYESASVDAYDENNRNSSHLHALPLHLDSHAYLTHLAGSSLDTHDHEMSLDHADFTASTDLDGTELDAFATHLLASDVPMMELANSNTASIPKYSKKRTALKKSSKNAAAATTAVADNHEEVRN